MIGLLKVSDTGQISCIFQDLDDERIARGLEKAKREVSVEETKAVAIFKSETQEDSPRAMQLGTS